jgi:hypothetical protein
LISIQDIDTKQSTKNDHTINGAKLVQFTVQRPFFEDSTANISQRGVESFNLFVENLFNSIPLITPIEHELFDSFGKIVVDDVLLSDSDNEVSDSESLDENDFIDKN